MLTRRPHPQGTIVSFHLKTQRPTSVVGSFNHWDPLLSPMRRVDADTHELNLLLQPGRHTFRYLAEGGHWSDEPEADGIEPNGRGQTHTVLIVE